MESLLEFSKLKSKSVYMCIEIEFLLAKKNMGLDAQPTRGPRREGCVRVRVHACICVCVHARNSAMLFGSDDTSRFRDHGHSQRL